MTVNQIQQRLLEGSLFFLGGINNFLYMSGPLVSFQTYICASSVKRSIAPKRLPKYLPVQIASRAE
jgi:hypothetical protein